MFCEEIQLLKANLISEELITKNEILNVKKFEKSVEDIEVRNIFDA